MCFGLIKSSLPAADGPATLPRENHGGTHGIA